MINYELGCPRRQETLQLLGVPRENGTPMNLVSQEGGWVPVDYSGQQVLSVTPSVVQASGRLVSAIWSAKNLIFILLFDFWSHF